MQYFVGENYDMDGLVVCAYTKDGESDPTFLYLSDGLKVEKF